MSGVSHPFKLLSIKMPTLPTELDADHPKVVAAKWRSEKRWKREALRGKRVSIRMGIGGKRRPEERGRGFN